MAGSRANRALLRGLRHLLFFSAFFFLFHFEDRSLGPLKVAVVWKAVVLGLFLVFVARRPVPVPGFVYAGFAASLLMVVHANAFADWPASLGGALRACVLPLLFMAGCSAAPAAVEIRARMAEKMEYAARVVAVYVALSVVPFFLGLSESAGVSLDEFGVEAVGFLGIFQTPHGASLVLSFSLVILLNSAVRATSTKQRFAYAALFTICAVALYLTYVRLGLLTALIGAYVVLISRRSTRFRVRLLPIVGLFVVTVAYLFVFDELFRARLLDQRIYQSSDSVLLAGSGRLLIWWTNIEAFWNASFPEKLIGIGPTASQAYMASQTGLHVFSHNAFVDSLRNNGVVGLLFQVVYYSLIWRYISCRAALPSHRMAIGMFWMVLVGALFQGGSFFVVDVLFALYLLSLRLTTNSSILVSHRAN